MNRSLFNAALVWAILGSAAWAQTPITAGINSPTYTLTDQNGVNLVSFRPSATVNDVGIGSKERPLVHTMLTDDGEAGTPIVRFSDNWFGKAQAPASYDTSATCTGVNSYLDVSLAGSADRMCGTLGGSYTPQRGTGTTMVTNADNTLTYTQPDGTQRLYGWGPGTPWYLAKMTAPDGLISTLTYKTVTLTNGTKAYRLQSVTRNDGLQLKYSYASNTDPTSYPLGLWSQLASVRAINNAVEYCDPAADTCALTQSWPVTTQSWSTSGSLKYMTLVDSGGRSTRFTVGLPTLSGGVYYGGVINFSGDQLLAIRRPTSTSADNVTYTYCAVLGEYYCMHSGVKKVTVDGVLWNYPATSGSGGVSLFIQTTVSRPVGGTQVVQQQRGNSAQGPLISYSDGIGLRTFYFEYALSNRLQHVTMGDGDDLTYAYDARGNITSETHKPTSGSALANLVKTANYDTTCTNPVKCNRPNWIKDARNNQTDYTYDPTHGGVTSVTAPPDDFGVRPQVRYGYTPRYAWYKNSSGNVVQAASPIYVLTTEKYCRKSAALPNGAGCTPASDEVMTTYDYGPSTGAANNLFLRGKAVTADGVTLRTCYGYDKNGNRISETQPKAGLTSCP